MAYTPVCSVTCVRDVRHLWGGREGKVKGWKEESGREREEREGGKGNGKREKRKGLTTDMNS